MAIVVWARGQVPVISVRIRERAQVLLKMLLLTWLVRIQEAASILRRRRRCVEGPSGCEFSSGKVSVWYEVISVRI
jgi:hypothetical protein